MTPLNTGRVQIGRMHIPTMPMHRVGSVSGPHRRIDRADRIVLAGCAGAALMLAVLAIGGWL